MTDQEILSLAYQLKASGDDRDLSILITQVKADAEQFAAAIDPEEIVGSVRLVMPDGSIQQKEIKGDGSTVSVNS